MLPPTARRREAGVEVLGGVEVEGEGPPGVEEVGLDELDLAELPDRRPLDLQREGLAPAEEVVLGDLAGEDEVLVGGEAGAELEGAGGLLLHLDRGHDAVVGAALPGGDLDGLEEAERGDALLGDLDGRAAVELALVDAQLAPDDLVAGLLVARRSRSARRGPSGRAGRRR